MPLMKSNNDSDDKYSTFIFSNAKPDPSSTK